MRILVAIKYHFWRNNAEGEVKCGISFEDEQYLINFLIPCEICKLNSAELLNILKELENE